MAVFCAASITISDKAATSVDGITWTARTLPATGEWRSIAWNGSVFCALSFGSNQAATSPDGITWTARTLPSIGEWRGLAWNGSVFCATCNSNIAATSPDGITWTARTLPVSASWRGLVWNGSVFCAVASGTDQAATSTDGITWTARTLPSSADWYSIAYQNPPFSGNPVIRQITFTGLTPAAIYTGFINPPFICQVNFTEIAPSASLLSIIKYTGSPVALSLSLLGLQSTAPMGVYIGNPVQGFIDFNGLTPSVLSTGFADSPEEKTYIDWVGNLGANKLEI